MKYILFSLFVLFLAGIASASLMENISIEQMTKEADHVVIGNVSNKISRWEGEKIVTDVDIVVIEVLSGKTIQTVRITYPGGEIDGKGLSVSNVTIPETGDRLLTFLKDSGNAISVLYGNHGQFIIDRDKAYRQSIVIGAEGELPEAFILEDLIKKIRGVK